MLFLAVLFIFVLLALFTFLTQRNRAGDSSHWPRPPRRDDHNALNDPAQNFNSPVYPTSSGDAFGASPYDAAGAVAASAAVASSANDSWNTYDSGGSSYGDSASTTTDYSGGSTDYGSSSTDYSSSSSTDSGSSSSSSDFSGGSDFGGGSSSGSWSE